MEPPFNQRHCYGHGLFLIYLNINFPSYEFINKNRCIYLVNASEVYLHKYIFLQ